MIKPKKVIRGLGVNTWIRNGRSLQLYGVCKQTKQNKEAQEKSRELVRGFQEIDEAILFSGY